MEVIFIRHGLADSNLNLENRKVGQQADLTEKGRLQIQATAKTVGGLLLESTTTIYSSPYPRTVESAEIIADTLGLEVIVDDRLQEVKKGILEGKPVDVAIEAESKIDPDERHLYRFPGAENWEDVADRGVDLIKEHRANNVEQLVAMTHNHPILCTVGRLLGRPTELWEDWDIGNAGVVVMSDDDDEWRLRRTIPAPKVS